VAEKKRRARGKGRTTKDRVLQARIPTQLDDELRDRAEQLGLSVSTIVRNTLLHTFNLVEGVVSDSAQIGRALQGRAGTAPDQRAAPSAAPADASAVVGWQELVLNQNGLCEQCNAILPVGARAAIGVPVQARPSFLCLTCLAGLSSPADHTQADETPSDKP
jgi:hypothetical protein